MGSISLRLHERIFTVQQSSIVELFFMYILMEQCDTRKNWILSYLFCCLEGIEKKKWWKISLKIKLTFFCSWEMNFKIYFLLQKDFFVRFLGKFFAWGSVSSWFIVYALASLNVCICFGLMWVILLIFDHF
jgi:intracellular septation protein A